MANHDFTLHTLGCGSAKPSLRHQPSSTVLSIRNKLYMIDCGENTQHAFAAMKLKPTRLSHIFLTHLHGDHVYGIPGLIDTLALSGCSQDITIHTFHKGAEMLSKIFRFFSPNLPLKIIFNEIDYADAIIFRDENISVRTVALDHRVPAVGFIFEENPRPRHIIPQSIEKYDIPFDKINGIKNGEDFMAADGRIIPNQVITTPPSRPVRYAHISDTAFIPGLGHRIGNVDLLLHETTYLDEHKDLAVLRGHSTASQAAITAREAGAHALLTAHYSSRYADDRPFLDEASSIFPNVILNREGLVLPVASVR